MFIPYYYLQNSYISAKALKITYRAGREYDISIIIFSSCFGSESYCKVTQQAVSKSFAKALKVWLRQRF